MVDGISVEFTIVTVIINQTEQHEVEKIMISNHVNIKFVDTPEDAPNYPASVTLLQMQECIIVEKGTVQGNPTIDIQMTDKNGKKYLIMATGNLIEMIGSSICGKRKQGYNQVGKDEK